MSSKQRLMLVAFLLLAAPLAGCVDQGPQPDQPDDDGEDGAQDGQTDEPDGVTIHISGDQWSFNRSEIQVEQGQTVEVVFTNAGTIDHNWGVDLNGDDQRDADDPWTETIGAGETDAVTFTAQETGEFVFFCSVSGHRSAGMEGTLAVT